MKEKQSPETARAIFAEAHRWALEICKRYNEEKPELGNHIGAILAYTVECMLGIPFNHKGREYDKMSRDFRDYLKEVHEDSKAQYEKIIQVYDKLKSAN